MKKFILPAGLAALAAISLSACGSTQPQIKTVTKTIRPAPIVKTVTKTVTRTPQSCLTALKDAEKATSLAGDFANAASDYPLMVRDAYAAGVTGNNAAAQVVLSRMKIANTKFDSINARLEPLVEQYNIAASACRHNQ